MNTRLLPIFFLFVFTLYVPQSFATCLINNDWLDAPCFDNPPYTLDEQEKAWAPYYDYKGAEWMDVKKVEMYDALNDGSFDEWSKEIENSNVYQYYVSTGEIPRQSNSDRILQEVTSQYFLELLGLSVLTISIISIMIFIIKRK